MQNSKLKTYELGKFKLHFNITSISYFIPIAIIISSMLFFYIKFFSCLKEISQAFDLHYYVSFKDIAYTIILPTVYLVIFILFIFKDTSSLSMISFNNKYPVLSNLELKNNNLEITFYNNLKIKNCIVYDYVNDVVLHDNLILKKANFLEFDVSNKPRNLMIILNSIIKLNPVIRLDFNDEKFEEYKFKYEYTTNSNLKKFYETNNMLYK